MKRSQISVLFGSVVLAATSAFHATGYAIVVRDTSAEGVSEFLQSAAKGLWLYASLHWLFIAVVAVVAAWLPSRLSRIVLALSSAVVAADAVLLLVFVGPFVGELLLAVAAVAHIVGAVLQKPTMTG